VPIVPADRATTSRLPFADDLERHGNRPALICGDRLVPYRELADRVREVGSRLGSARRLILLRADATVESVTGYLAALRAGNPVLLAPSGAGGAAESVDRLVRTYDPDVVLGADPDGGPWAVRERRAGSAHDLHPDLALLLSTSGSTGSPKLVRLSHRNLRANAESIATYLGIDEEDRAITTLPLHYSYGLSVLHTHLLRGASLLLTDRSVTEPELWDVARTWGATSFAGVPYTFELLERIGFAELDLPRLRYVTSAGGRLEPDRARRFAALARRRGWDLVLMYGQTEATARIAYLPPHLAESHPHAIGVAVPGGTLRIDPVPDCPEPASGEIVYSGPNVMLGYAEGPADLALGRTVHELRTGDLGRLRDGLVEVTGRRSRIAKVFGVRVDLDHLEGCLAAAGSPGRCLAVDDELVVVAGSAVEAAKSRQMAARACGLPQRVVRAVVLDPLPRLATGKVDYAALRQHAFGAEAATRAAEGPTDPRATRAALHEVLAQCLGRDDVTDDSTFAGLGGDSLSYVEVSVRFEDVLGTLPSGWHLAPVRALAADGRPLHPRRESRAPDEDGDTTGDTTGDAGHDDRVAAGDAGHHDRVAAGRRHLRLLETSVLLRAVAIVLVVGSHAQLFTVVGGAHLLLAVAGFNVARFQLAPTDRAARLRNLMAGARRVAVPTAVWATAVTVVSALTGAVPGYGVRTMLLLNDALGPWTWGPAWHFWFVECLVYLLLGLALLLSLPAVHRLDLRHPFAVPVAVACAALATRYGMDIGDVRIYCAPVLLWLFALGWAAARARTVPRRLLVSALAAATVPGFFGDPAREALVVGGLLLLTWVTGVRVPAWSARPLAALASGSLYVYLVHWQVFPPIAGHSKALAVAASLLVGVAAWRAARSLPVRRRTWAGRRADPIRSPGRAQLPGPGPLTSAAQA
jgi:acyl-CoA synthetase (AMP-forming)/AMP-acid ligase II